MKKISMLSILALMICFLFAALRTRRTRKRSSVEGRVVTGTEGRLLALRLWQRCRAAEYQEGHDWFEVKTKADGTFLIEGFISRTYYRIVCDGGQCNDLRDRIRSLPYGETLKLEKDFVLIFSPFKVSSRALLKICGPGWNGRLFL